MSREGEKRESAWFLAGTAVPLAAAAAECSWIGAGLISFAMLVLRNVNQKTAPERLPGWLRGLRVLVGTALLGATARMLAEIWLPRTESRAVALILLLLAAHACKEGRQKPARIGAVLLRLIALGGLLIFFYWVAEQKTAVQAVKGTGNLHQISLLWMIPLVTAELIPGKKGKGTLLPLVLLTACLTGETALYPWVSGLTWNGNPLRLEVLLSVLMVMGWYCCYTLQLAAIKENLDKSGRAEIRQYGLYAAVLTAGAMLYMEVIKEGYLIGAIFILYTVIPCILRGKEIKRRKAEKGVDK